MTSIIDMRGGTWRRIYSDGAKLGRRINSVSFSAEGWFWRLLTLADDFGTFPADPETCRLLAAPMRASLRASEVHGWLQELAGAHLIERYEVGGEAFGQIVDFTRLQPAGKNGRRFKRWPGPGESGGIRGNPGESRESEKSKPSENQNHSQNQNQKNPPTPLAREQCAHAAPAERPPTATQRPPTVVMPQAPFARGELSESVVRAVDEFYGDGRSRTDQTWHDVRVACEKTSDAAIVAALASAKARNDEAGSRVVTLARALASAKTKAAFEGGAEGKAAGSRRKIAMPTPIGTQAVKAVDPAEARSSRDEVGRVFG